MQDRGTSSTVGASVNSTWPNRRGRTIADLAAAVLLVAGHGFEQCLRVEARGVGRQAEATQERLDPVGDLGPDPAQPFGEPALGDHADGDRLAVLECAAVTCDGLDGVADRVAEIQHRPQAGLLTLVMRHDIGLQAAAPGDDLTDRRRVLGQDRLGMVFEVVEEVRVEDHAVLDHLGQPAAQLAVGQGREGRRVDPDADGLVEGPDDVLGAAAG